MRGPLCLLGAFIAIVFLPGLAAASNYCVGAVSGGECVASYPATGTGLQSALDDADNNLDIGGTPDTVRIGPGSYSAVHGFRTLGGDLSIVGSGQATVLSSTGGTSSDTVLALKLGGAPRSVICRSSSRESEPRQSGTSAKSPTCTSAAQEPSMTRAYAFPTVAASRVS